MRGLKQDKAGAIFTEGLSHPLRMRGLKPYKFYHIRPTRPSRILYGCVDWNLIYLRKKLKTESRILYGCVDWNFVFGLYFLIRKKSHPLRMRGLKPFRPANCRDRFLSHLLRMRGLKRVGNPGGEHRQASHPLRMCGLKHLYAWSLKRRRGYVLCGYNYYNTFVRRLIRIFVC